MLAGVITIPLGAPGRRTGGGFPVAMVLRNLIPIVLIAVLIAGGAMAHFRGMVKGFTVFGKIVVIVITVGLAAPLWRP